MDIRFIKSYKSIQEGFEWRDVPNFAIITGINGVGKTQLLDAIKEHNREIVSITDENSMEEEIVVSDKNATEKSMEGLIKYKNDYDARQVTKKELENSIKEYAISRDGVVGKLSHQTDAAERQKLRKDFDVFNKDILNCMESISQLTEYAYEKELEAISEKAGKDAKNLTDEEVRENANPYFNTLTEIEDFKQYVKQEYEERKERLVQLSKKGDYDRLRDEGGKEYAHQIINRCFHEFGFDYFEMQDPFGEDSKHIGKIWFKGQMGEEVEYKDLSSGEQMIVKYIFWTFGRDFRGNRINTMLLDEPDNHLHPSMCQMMVNILYELSKPKSEGGSGIRIIITTHSPSTVAFAPEGNLFVMEKNEKSERSIRSVSTEEAEDVLSEGIFTYRKALDTFNLILRSSHQNLLFVEGKTDVIHLEKAIDALEMSIDVDIIPINDAHSLGDFISSTPSALFGGRKMMALLDSDDEGEKAYSNITGEEATIRGIKRITARQCDGLSYVFKIQPYDALLSKYCPIEFLYPKEYLDRNNILEKRNYQEFKNKFKEMEKSPDDTDKLTYEFKEESTLRPFKVYADGKKNEKNKKENEKRKTNFANYVKNETDPAIFEGFRPTLELIQQVIDL